VPPPTGRWASLTHGTPRRSPGVIPFLRLSLQPAPCVASESSLPTLATGVHTIAYLAVTGLIAGVVYSEFGLAILRKAWINLNVVWGAALVVTSVVTLMM
jgi:hypothetical protein